MTKYVKLPIEVEATQWFKHGDHKAVVLRFEDYDLRRFYSIRTPEGVMRVMPGDWIITSTKGEVYPCKDDIFRATYKEAVPSVGTAKHFVKIGKTYLTRVGTKEEPCGENSTTTSLSRRLILLAALAPSRGVPHTTTQIQKLLFLIDRKIADLVKGPHFDFKPGDLGPIDCKNVPAVLDSLVESALMHCTCVSKKKYSLTPRGQDIGDLVLGSMDSVGRDFIYENSEFVLSLSFPQLIACINKRYPDMCIDGGPPLDNPCLIVPRAIYDKLEGETRTSYYKRTTNMEHIPRLIEEKKELDIKIAALNRFVTESPDFESISATEQADLTDQLYFMTQYSIVLERRLFELSSPNV